VIGGLQRLLRVNAQMTGQVDTGKEQIPQFVDPLGGIKMGSGGLLTFGQLLAHLAEYPLSVVPVEPDPGRAPLKLLGTRQGRQGMGDTAEQTARPCRTLALTLGRFLPTSCAG
jgi:hypothetical protein